MLVSWLLNSLSIDVLTVLTDKLHCKYSICHAQTIFLITVQEAHKEYNSLMDQIRAKYEQLDSGKNGSFDTPAFKTETCELANLLACVSQLCQKLNLLTPKELYRPTVFKH